MRIVGIDPGMSGALALLVDGQLEGVTDMPTLDGEVSGALLAAHLQLAAPDLVVIETVHSMPQQGVASSFKFGKNYGIVLGAVTALQHPLVKMTPVEWKRINGLFHKPKEASRRLAIELWPHLSHKFERAKDDGRAEAALIARAHSSRIVQEINRGTSPDRSGVGEDPRPVHHLVQRDDIDDGADAH